MATVKTLQDLPAASELAGTDYVLVSKNGVTLKAQVSQIVATAASMSLASLVDVSIATPANDQVLTYESATSFWKAKNAATVSIIDGGNF